MSRRPRWKKSLLHKSRRLFSCGGLDAHVVQAAHSPTWQSEPHAPRHNVYGRVDCCDAEPQVPASAAPQRPVFAHAEPLRYAQPRRRSRATSWSCEWTPCNFALLPISTSLKYAKGGPSGLAEIRPLNLQIFEDA